MSQKNVLIIKYIPDIEYPMYWFRTRCFYHISFNIM